MNETINNLLRRRSVRSYKEEQIKDEELETILEVGKFAPSAMGRQPGMMVAVQDKALIAELSKINAAVMGSDSDPFYGAPTVVIVFSDTERSTWLQDGSLVMGNLMNAAFAVGVDSCWINRANEMFKTERGKELKKAWGVGDTFGGVGCCILGYRDGELPAPKPRKDNWVVRV